MLVRYYLQISFATCSTSNVGDGTSCAATRWGIGLSRLQRLLFELAVSDGLSSLQSSISISLFHPNYIYHNIYIDVRYLEIYGLNEHTKLWA